MYGLSRFGEYPQVIADELEDLIAAIRNVFYKEHNEDGSHIISVPSSLVPVGSITMWSGASAPEKWLLCDGTQVSRVTYKSLFDICGTTYGIGDGSTTFNLPDMRQKFPLGKAASGTGNTLGATGGDIDHTHGGGAHTHSFSYSATTSTDGSHSHSGSISSAGAHTHATGSHKHAISSAGSATSGVDINVREQQTQTDIFDDAGTSENGSHTHDATIGTEGAHSHSVSGSGTTGSASASLTASNPPFVVVNYIIHSGV
jgi:microcystin-dependent protein